MKLLITSAVMLILYGLTLVWRAYPEQSFEALSLVWLFVAVYSLVSLVSIFYPESK